MCSPAALMIGGGALSAAGQIRQGNAAAGIANYNARLADYQAQDSLARGSIEEGRYRNQIDQITGQQKVATAKRNVAVSGTAIDLLADTARIGEEDALTIRENSRRESAGQKEEGRLLRMQGRMAKRDTRFGATTSLLTSGANAYYYGRR